MAKTSNEKMKFLDTLSSLYKANTEFTLTKINVSGISNSNRQINITNSLSNNITPQSLQNNSTMNAVINTMPAMPIYTNHLNKTNIIQPQVNTKIFKIDTPNRKYFIYN